MTRLFERFSAVLGKGNFKDLELCEGGEDTEKPRELGFASWATERRELGRGRGRDFREEGGARGWGFRRVTGLEVAGKGISWREELANGQDNLPDWWCPSHS